MIVIRCKKCHALNDERNSECYECGEVLVKRPPRPAKTPDTDTALKSRKSQGIEAHDAGNDEPDEDLEPKRKDKKRSKQVKYSNMIVANSIMIIISAATFSVFSLTCAIIGLVFGSLIKTEVKMGDVHSAKRNEKVAIVMAACSCILIVIWVAWINYAKIYELLFKI